MLKSLIELKIIQTLLKTIHLTLIIGMSIDTLDMKIIKCLVEDARRTYRSIAEETGVSEATIKNRIDSLMDKGVIQRFTVILDYHKLGRAIKSFIGLKVQPSKLQDIIEHMKKIPDVQVLYRTSGDVDLMFEVIFEKMEDLNSFLEKELTLDGILGTVVTVVIGPYKRCPWSGL